MSGVSKFFGCLIVVALGYVFFILIPKILIDEGMDITLVIYLIVLVAILLTLL